ncbi:MAG TPA: LLM class flavin-dependent oxidoreductase [Pseudonocardia sp.]|jgi:alkanesulfonate monooxygenase SsuD/methylene tetrahydromethanopterin reductase-like flavin-dependent oxidoreductase (luciferase family)|nr:LLM class flavin-dependent oxidoreductase [Pseudonocardia sp.]
MTSPLSVLILTSTPPEEVGSTAALIEQLGFGQLWVAEDYFFHGGFTAAAAALQATVSIPVGIGIVAAVARHPAVTAMEVASLARTYPGRFSAGIGHGLPAWTEQMGLRDPRPLAVLEECITGVRDLLAGRTVTRKGHRFTFREVTLVHPAQEEVPLLSGVIGPRSLELSGRIADGTIMSALASTGYLRDALGHVRKGMGEGGRAEHLTPVFALSSVSADRAEARAAIRPVLAFYLSALGATNALTGALGYNHKLAELLEGGLEHLTKHLPDEWIDELVIAGDPTDVRARVESFVAAGATSVVLSPINPATAKDELHLVAKEVLPKL